MNKKVFSIIPLLVLLTACGYDLKELNVYKFGLGFWLTVFYRLLFMNTCNLLLNF